MSRPNLLLITTDQQRWDAMGLNGNDVLRTPTMDNLAANGVNFERGYTTCPSCIAARRTILTGQSGHTHGMVGYKDGEEFFPKFTLPGLLSDSGYHTQLVGKLHQFPQRKRYGFDDMVMSNGPSFRPDSAWMSENDYTDWLRDSGVRAAANEHGINGNSRIARPFHLEEQYHQTTWLTSKAIEFMTRRHDPSCPFFLHLSYWAPHPPLIPPQAYYDRYINRKDLRPRIGSWLPKFDKVPKGIAGDSATGPFDEEEIHDAIAGYYGLVNHIDDQLQRLLESYFVYGGPRAKDPLWIIFTSDHGEMLGDHHLFRKSLGYEASAHVPFFIAGRNVPIAKKRSRALVCLEDLLPTFCDLAGVDVPAGVDGKSLKPIITGETTDVRDALFGEHSGGFANHFLVQGRHKYLWFAHTNEEQVFDLQDDPYEMNDISARVEILQPLRLQMAARLKGRKDYTYDVEKLRPLGNRPPTAFWKNS
jgi:arylsulfatase